MTSSFDLWRVQLGNGEVVVMSLDQLDDAFQAGRIHEHTHVLREGMTTWMTVADAAGIGAEPLTPSAYPPPAVVMETPGPSSIRPFVSEVSDLDLSDLGLPKKSSKAKTAFFTLAAAMIVGGAGFAATHVPQVQSRVQGLLGGASPVANIAAAAPVHAPPVQIVPATPVAPAAQPAPAPAAPAAVAATSPASDPAAAANGRLTPDQIRALMEGDKTRAAVQEKKAEAKKQTREKHAAKRSGKPVFSKGGSKYDPLNASL